MEYALILFPHQNGRYEAAMRVPAASELQLILSGNHIQTEVTFKTFKGVNMLVFEADYLSNPVVWRICRHSLAFWFGILSEGRFTPLSGAYEPCLGADLPSILKYKGKTNEHFTQMLINTALYACDFRMSENITLIDPMCGKGTTLFQALNLGFSAFGSDIDRKDLAEGTQFFIKYLQLNKFKHKQTQTSQTIPGSPAVTVTSVSFVNAAGGSGQLKTACAEAGRVDRVFGKGKAELLCCDLPYGIQHAPGGLVSFEQLLREALPAWRSCLKKGGAVALSYNTKTLKTLAVRQLLKEYGFAVKEGGVWDGFEHWVEQAVTRDIAAAVKTED